MVHPAETDALHRELVAIVAFCEAERHCLTSFRLREYAEKLGFEWATYANAFEQV